MKLEEFLNDLENQNIPHQSRKASNLLIGTILEFPEHQTKLELHSFLVSTGLNIDSPLFNTLWEKHSNGLKLR